MPLKIKWRPSSEFFVPARNSRHRLACLSLYRALLKLVPKIPLPEDLATAWGTKHHPVARIIRRAFQRNARDVSPRLIHPALKAGYSALETLSLAADPTSAEHQSVIAFLQKRLSERELSLRQSPAPNSRSVQPNTRKREPLLVRVKPEPTPEDPHPMHIYVPTYRPRPSEALPLGKKRKIPVLDIAQGGFPLLRTKKPNSPELDWVLSHKIKRRARRKTKVVEMEGDLGVWGEEDQWEELVVDQLENEIIAPIIGKIKRQQGNLTDEERRNFTMALDELEAWLNTEAYGGVGRYKSVLYRSGMMHLTDRLDAEHLDSLARADGMRKIIYGEIRLAEEEEAMRIKQKKKEKSELKQKNKYSSAQAWAREWSKRKGNAVQNVDAEKDEFLRLGLIKHA